MLILSSLQVWATIVPIPQELKAIKRFAPTILYQQKDSAKYLIDRGINIAESYQDDTSKALLQNQKGIYHFLNADYGLAVGVFDSAIAVNEQYQIWDRLIDNLNNKGYIYRVVGNYKTALSHFQLASKICDSVKLYQKLPITLTNLGILHRLMGNHFKAIEHFERAARIAIKEGQGVELANIYHNLGETYAAKKEYENAIFYYDKVVQLSDNSSIPFDPTNTFSKMAEVMKKQGRVDAAIFYNEEVLKITKQRGFRVGEVQSLIQLGKCYIAKNNLNLAERYLVEGIFEATALQRMDIIDNAYFLLSDIYETQGNLTKALQINKIGSHLQDSLSSAETKRQIIEMQMIFASEKQQKDFDVLEKENIINQARISNKTNAIVFLSIGIILLILIIILYNSYATVKHDNNKRLEKLVASRTLDLKRKEQILTAQNKKLMEYAHMTSHVLRKPLANILGVINLLESHDADDEHSRDEMFHVIKDAAYEMDEAVIESINILSEKFEFEPESDSKPEKESINTTTTKVEEQNHELVG